MKIILGSAGWPLDLRNLAVAVGNFDGVHRGHQAVLEKADVAVTFEPHPRAWFQPEAAPSPLTPLPLKLRLFKALGLRAACVLAFDAQLAQKTAQDFVNEVMVGALGARSLRVGYDFHFGRGREGTPARLEELARQYGLTLHIVPPVTGDQGDPISSSAIREALRQGEIERATHALGYRWRVEGKVRQGNRLGRVLGFPTANITLPANTPVRQGVYAVRARAEGAWYAAAASFGTRPQFEDENSTAQPVLEIHLLDFSGDLYGQTLEVEFCSWLRPQETFSSTQALVDQMGRDCDQARGVITRCLSEPVTPLQNRLEG